MIFIITKDFFLFQGVFNLQEKEKPSKSINFQTLTLMILITM